MRPVAQRPEHGLDMALPRPDETVRQPDTRALRALAEENALLARELGRVQARCTQWRDDCIAQADRLEAQLLRARGALLAKETELAVLRDALAASGAGRAARPPSPPMAGTRVLCVGGRARQVPVYREMVERCGGRFTHVDGATPDGLHALQRALREADLVVLQPAYACQGACRLVESHCALRGVRCVQLDKACALGFMQGLEQALFLSGHCACTRMT